MDSETEELYYQKIKEYVLDEDKIVTCTTIVNDLNVSISVAKTILENFLKDYRKLKPKELGASFIISGILAKNNQLSVCYCEESKIKDNKSKFAKVFSEVLYAVQKNQKGDVEAVGIVDGGVFSTGNVFFEHGYTIGKNCVKRQSTKKVPSEPIAKEPARPTNKINGFFAKASTSGEAGKEKLTKLVGQETSKEALKEAKKEKLPTGGKNGTKGKTGGLASFLSSGVKETKKENASTSEKNGVKGKTSGLANFLNSGAKKIENEAGKENLKGEVKKEKVEETPKKVKKVEKSTQEEKMNVSTPSKKDTNVKKRKNAGKEEQSTKKRRRIQVVSDSDSDPFQDEESDVDVIDNSILEEDIKVDTKPIITKPGKRRKAVDKTYKDEEGYMVTTTEYIYVTASEDEEEKPVKAPVVNTNRKIMKPTNSTDSEADGKDVKKKGKNKKAPSGKQPTLMNFFTKK